jgi:hypothetical protein
MSREDLRRCRKAKKPQNKEGGCVVGKTERGRRVALVDMVVTMLSIHPDEEVHHYHEHQWWRGTYYTKTLL